MKFDVFTCILIGLASASITLLYIITLKIGKIDEIAEHRVSFIGSFVEFRQRIEKKRKLWTVWLFLVCWILCIVMGIGIALTQ